MNTRVGANRACCIVLNEEKFLCITGDNDSRLASLESKIVQLSSENRLLKRAWLIVTACLFGIGFLVAADGKQDRTELKAERFILVNKKGEERGEWKADENAVLFTMKDNKGSKKISIATTEEDVAFLISDGDGKNVLAELSTNKSKTRLIIRDKESRASISLHALENGAVGVVTDSAGKARLQFGANNEEALILVKNAKEKLRLSLGAGAENGVTLYNENEKPVVSLSQNDRTGSGLQILSGNGNPLVRMGLKMPDTPEIVIFDAEKKVLFSKP